MISKEEYRFSRQPDLLDIIDLSDDIDDDDRSRLRGLFEHAATLVINRPHQMERVFVDKVVGFLLKYHREFRSAFEDDFLAKALLRVCQNHSPEIAQEIEASLIYQESDPDRVSYLDLYRQTRISPEVFLASYDGFYRELYHGKKRPNPLDIRDFENFLQAIVIGLSFANKVDDACIKTPVDLVVNNIRDRLNKSDNEDPILVEIYNTMTDPRLDTGKHEISNEILEALKDPPETPTDPVDMNTYGKVVIETQTSEFTTDPDISSPSVQKMYMLISFERLIANVQEFCFTTWYSLSNEQVIACVRNYEECLRAIDTCWDWKNWDYKENFDHRNLAFVHQTAQSRFDDCLRDLVRVNSKPDLIESSANFQPKFVGVSMDTYRSMKEAESDADYLGIVLEEVDEYTHKHAYSYFEGKVVYLTSSFTGVIEDPSKWSFETNVVEEDELDDDAHIRTAEIDRERFAKTLLADSER